MKIPTISTGEIIRNAIRQETELGIKATEYINKGLLVPDNVVIQMVRSRLIENDCDNGYILDGFPRTVPQADALEQMNIEIDKVLNIVVDEDKIIERLSGRRQCEKCGATFHLKYKPTKKTGICDVCGGNTVIRQDDTVETIKQRLKVYHEQTKPLIEYYSNKGLLVVVYGQEIVEDTTKEVFKALGVD